MTLWLLLALMTAAAVFAVLWPLSRRAGVPRTGGDVAVYRDQIDEIARDRATGLIGETEAEAARVEVSRRLIAAADAAETDAGPMPGAAWRRRVAAVAALVVVPAVAAALYLAFGSPQLPGQPLASRANTPAQDRSLEGLVAQVEAHLARSPEDGRGWEVVAPVYLRLGRADDAVKARRNALRLNGASADREADLAEALLAAANGVITAESKAGFERALARDASHIKARYFLGLAAEQDGNREAAAAIWRAMLKDAPPMAPWAPLVRQALARVDGAPVPGPSADDIAAAQSMAPEQQTAMVRGMVERLAARLKQDGSDLEGWLRLVRAYTVLGETERARQAANDARRAVGTDADKLRRLDDLAKLLGLEG
ncbi:MAG: cytochrome c-type biosis protein CcmH [Hyphomicrobiales bacterium]|jgi:cytochrome c-type biogenesis protein CcmH|nr:cytochrome c-type biosis protein CcmH [Hyphomicrobiales bacterium]